MRDYFPLIVVGAIVGVLSVVFVTAYALIKNKKEALGFDRAMKDKEIIKRLLKYAKPLRHNLPPFYSLYRCNCKTLVRA